MDDVDVVDGRKADSKFFMFDPGHILPGQTSRQGCENKIKAFTENSLTSYEDIYVNDKDWQSGKSYIGENFF